MSDALGDITFPIHIEENLSAITSAYVDRVELAPAQVQPYKNSRFSYGSSQKHENVR